MTDERVCACGGAKQRRSEMCRPCRDRQPRTARWTHARALESVRLLAAEVGRVPVVADFTHGDPRFPSASKLWALGGLNQFLEEQGMPSRRRRAEWSNKHFTDEQMLAPLRRHFMLTGESPSSTDWKRERRTPSTLALRHRFGTWNRALELAGCPTRRPGETRTTRRGEPANKRAKNRQMVTGRGNVGPGSVKRVKI